MEMTSQASGGLTSCMVGSCLKSLSSGGVDWWAGVVTSPIQSRCQCRIPAWKVYEMWGVKLWER